MQREDDENMINPVLAVLYTGDILHCLHYHLQDPVRPQLTRKNDQCCKECQTLQRTYIQV